LAAHRPFFPWACSTGPPRRTFSSLTFSTTKSIFSYFRAVPPSMVPTFRRSLRTTCLRSASLLSPPRCFPCRMCPSSPDAGDSLSLTQSFSWVNAPPFQFVHSYPLLFFGSKDIIDFFFCGFFFCAVEVGACFPVHLTEPPFIDRLQHGVPRDSFDDFSLFSPRFPPSGQTVLGRKKKIFPLRTLYCRFQLVLPPSLRCEVPFSPFFTPALTSL